MQSNSIICERHRTAPVLLKRIVLSDRVQLRKPSDPLPFVLPTTEGKPVISAKCRTSIVTKAKQHAATIAKASEHREAVTIDPLPIGIGRTSKSQKAKNNSNRTKVVKPKDKIAKCSASLKKILKATVNTIPKIKIRSSKNVNPSIVRKEVMATFQNTSMPSLADDFSQSAVELLASTQIAPNAEQQQSNIVASDTDANDDDEDPTSFFQRPCPCVCGRHNGDDFVGCNGGERCERKWFHISCMGLKHNDINSMRGWMCPMCY